MKIYNKQTDDEIGLIYETIFDTETNEKYSLYRSRYSGPTLSCFKNDVSNTVATGQNAWRIFENMKENIR